MTDSPDTRLIVGRIEAEGKSIREAFAAHEVRDQGRFEAGERALKGQTRELKGSIDANTAQIKTQNSRVTKIEAAVGIVQDREAQAQAQRSQRITLKQGLIVAAVTLVGTFLVYVLLAATGVTH